MHAEVGTFNSLLPWIDAKQLIAIVFVNADFPQTPLDALRQLRQHSGKSLHDRIGMFWSRLQILSSIPVILHKLFEYTKANLRQDKPLGDKGFLLASV